MKMSLKWLRQKLIKSKAVDPNLWFNPFDLKSDKTIPKTLRDSLISVESDRHQQVGDDQILEHDSEEETWEVASEYPDGCDQDGCLLKQASGSEIYIALKRDSSLSSVSLIQNVSSTSDNKTLGIDGTFLWITYLVPVRNESVIIHWKVKSIYGVRGFQVKSFLPSISFSNLTFTPFLRFLSMGHWRQQFIHQNEDQNFFRMSI